MYLKQAHNKKTGRTYLSMAKSYREEGSKYPKTKTVKSFGYLDELEKKYKDPVAHFRAVVEESNLAEMREGAEYTITAKKDRQLTEGTSARRNYGYIVIMKVFHELGLDRFLVNRRARDTRIEYNTSAVMKMLVISRILSPGSKRDAHARMGRYFDFEERGGGEAFSLQDVYRSLPHFAGLAKDMQLLVHDRMTKRHGRKLDLVYYDVTNYYFEIDREDGLRRKGYGKDGKKTPLVQMGLAVDADGIPISYEVFPGNESEKLRLRPAMRELRMKYAGGNIIAVADSAQNTGNNIYYLDRSGQYYVFSQSIRGGSGDFKKYVVDGAGYEWHGETYRRKSRNERRLIKVDFEKSDGTVYKKDVWVDQRQIVFYSEKYAARSRLAREAAVLKAAKIAGNPAAYTRATSHGALKYVMNVEVDRKTGELKPAKGEPCLDLELIREEEKYDGYYAIVTNVFDEGGKMGRFSDDGIIEIYRGLWQIEDTFRVSKSDIEARPVFLSREERIQGHFLICFISLVIIRLIQKATGNRYSPAELAGAMDSISCTHEGGNLYLFDHRDRVTDALGEAFGFDFTRQRLTKKEIKKNLGDSKK